MIFKNTWEVWIGLKLEVQKIWKKQKIKRWVLDWTLWIFLSIGYFEPHELTTSFKIGWAQKPIGNGELQAQPPPSSFYVAISPFLSSLVVTIVVVVLFVACMNNRDDINEDTPYPTLLLLKIGWSEVPAPMVMVVMVVMTSVVVGLLLLQFPCLTPFGFACWQNGKKK